MSSKIKITLDSENRENNKIIINDVDISESVTGIRIDWNVEKPLKLSVDFVSDIK